MPGAVKSARSVEMPLVDEAATAALAENLARIAKPGDIFALEGELGCGKTAFARAFIRAAGAVDDDIPSPTFTLTQVYDGANFTIHHFDLYRLCAPEEAFELNIDDAFSSGVSLIEWPHHLGDLLPSDRLDVILSFADSETARTVRLSGPKAWQKRLKGVRLKCL
jgi:tRNA threonylcarbamoyl adenosine modification protein YjeE